jgi:hypothetical protein
VVLMWRKSSPFGSAFVELAGVLEQALANRR